MCSKSSGTHGRTLDGKTSAKARQTAPCTPAILGGRQGGAALDFCIGPQTENRLKKLIRIWRALHEYVNFVHDPENSTGPYLSGPGPVWIPVL